MDDSMPEKIRARWIVGLVLLMFLSGCSQTRLAYRYADWGVVWWVEDYISVTSEQEAQLNQDLEALRQWHCSAELPRYQQWLAVLKSDLAEGPPSEATVLSHQEQLMDFVPDLLDRASPIAVNLLSSLSDEQVAELAENMAEKQRELEQKMLEGTPAETARARSERTIERIEQWLGDLNPEQQAIIKTWSADRGRQTEIWLAGRRNWQLALLDVLEQRGEPDFADQVKELLVHSERARGAEYQAMLAESRVAMAGLMHDLLQAGDTRHQDHLLARASELKGDFAALTCS
ncbi:DUF6279 family lipoprotein [Marinobacter nauticus]|uniref:DUF6279 family lipoprotein n=1 Tax=Marinobacter nauticus TaxID=2743 RepID=UPI001C99C7FD|nr:DUF6279 family lipoprotein [Marinobacter nauticus]MBY5963238.1 DUF3549 domain-containing protein [Marinobacter nauticus]